MDYHFFQNGIKLVTSTGALGASSLLDWLLVNTWDIIDRFYQLSDHAAYQVVSLI